MEKGCLQNIKVIRFMVTRGLICIAVTAIFCCDVIAKSIVKLRLLDDRSKDIAYSLGLDVETFDAFFRGMTSVISLDSDGCMLPLIKLIPSESGVSMSVKFHPFMKEVDMETCDDKRCVLRYRFFGKNRFYRVDFGHYEVDVFMGSDWFPVPEECFVVNCSFEIVFGSKNHCNIRCRCDLVELNIWQLLFHEIRKVAEKDRLVVYPVWVVGECRDATGNWVLSIILWPNGVTGDYPNINGRYQNGSVFGEFTPTDHNPWHSAYLLF